MSTVYEREARVLPFRRRQFVARHRRRSRLLALWRPFLGAVLVVGAPVALGVWILTSSRFWLREIKVAPTDRVPVSWVHEALEPFEGQHLVRLPLAAVEETLRGHPWVAAAEVAKELPDALAVRLIERRPAGVLRSSEGLLLIDEEGEVVAPFDPRRDPADLPLIDPGEGEPETVERSVGAALEVAARLEKIRPDWAAGLSEVRILSEEEFSLYTSVLPFPLKVRAGDMETGIRRLEPLLPEILGRYPEATSVDLRFAQQIVIQPAA